MYLHSDHLHFLLTILGGVNKCWVVLSFYKEHMIPALKSK
jgi:hypothetical protein